MKKIGILKLVLLVSLLSFTIFSCNENPMDDDFTLKNQSNIIEEKTLIILGEQYPNPYSVSNMLNAYQYLKNNGGLDIHKGADWIRADILHDLMKEGIVSPNDVFDCLTPLITTQNKLKEALQEKSPANHNIIETRFSILNNN